MRHKRASKAARECVSNEIARHCRKKRGRCKRPGPRAQAVAIAFSVCRRKGFHSLPKIKR